MTDQASPALWRVSAFDDQRRAAASSAFTDLRRHTVVSSTLSAELRLLDQRRDSSDALQVIATCVRLREPALIYLQCDEGVWPVTLFPDQMIYHSPRNLLRGSERSLGSLQAMEVEPPGVRPPGHWMHERIAHAEAYHPLVPALWALALQGPRIELLHEISGTAAYRALRNPAVQNLPTPGALGPVIARLRQSGAALRTIAAWPGMSTERAMRLVNALYLTSNLIVSRAHPAAQPGMLGWLLARLGR
jgi:hypothetical protein